jgi:hypothetical protein
LPYKAEILTTIHNLEVHRMSPIVYLNPLTAERIVVRVGADVVIIIHAVANGNNGLIVLAGYATGT